MYMYYCWEQVYVGQVSLECLLTPGGVTLVPPRAPLSASSIIVPNLITDPSDSPWLGFVNHD